MMSRWSHQDRRTRHASRKLHGPLINPAFSAQGHSRMHFGATSNGSPIKMCPIEINVWRQITRWCKGLSNTHEMHLLKRAGGVLLASSKFDQVALPVVDSVLRHLLNWDIYSRLNTWGRGLEIPRAPKQTFHQWYGENPGGKP
jgi:L-lactate dehydrogenase complex protein LldF